MGALVRENLESIRLHVADPSLAPAPDSTAGELE
jgi:hypothetical protein